MLYRPDVPSLIATHHVPGLLDALRYGPDPTVRCDAARALGDEDDPALIGNLIRSATEDPDDNVSEIAYRALEGLIGNRVDQVIKDYLACNPDPDPWLNTPPLEESSQQPQPSQPLEDPTAGWSGDEVGALTSLAQSSRRLKGRLHAIRTLGDARSMNAIESLLQLAMHGNAEQVSAARNALTAFYGDQTDGVLAAYLSGESIVEKDGEGVDKIKSELPSSKGSGDQPAHAMDWGRPSVPAVTSPEIRSKSKAASPYNQAPPVVEEASTGVLHYILLGALLVILLLGVVYLIFR